MRDMFHNSTFWIGLFMGVLPMLVLGFLNDREDALYGLLFFFAVMWAGIFKGFVLDSRAPLKFAVGAFFFTGIIGMPALLMTYKYHPAFYLEMTSSSSRITALIGSILHTGVNEEICKFAPVVLYLVWKRKTWSVEEALLIGVFSGLGFAAFENVGYAMGSAMDTVRSVLSSSSRNDAIVSVFNSSVSSMTTVLIRSPLPPAVLHTRR